MNHLLQILLLMFMTTTVFGVPTEKPCLLRKFDAGYVCVCTDDYCDNLKTPELSNATEWMLVTSTDSGQRFNISTGEFNPQFDNEATNIAQTFLEINQNVLHQEIVGFGGSFTGAVSYILDKLSKNLRDCIYNSYYSSDDGIGYSILRMPIGGCDFDLLPWTYNEHPENDSKLTNFTALHPKDVLRVGLLKELMNVSQNRNIKIIGITWSPPRWMKEKGEWAGKNDNQLKMEYYQTWADYHVKWLDLMHSVGMPDIWAISTGNEPKFAHHTPFMGLSWNVSSLATWVVEHLVPALKESMHSAVKIHTFDDNRDVILSWLNEFNASNHAAIDYISAIGVHGYFDKVSSPSSLDEVKEKFPDKSILYTEMCFGVTGPLSSTGPKLGTWAYVEELIDMLMQNFMHNVNGYIDWNIILDSHGGPSYINNVVDAMIIANENFTEIYKQPLFYAAAHFMKFILPGSKRLETNATGVNLMDLSSLAFRRPDGKVAAIFYNKSQQSTIFLRIIDRFKGQVDIAIKPKSLNTFIYSAI